MDSAPSASKSAATSAESTGLRWMVRLIVLAVTVMIVRTAWMCDDAFITLRTVDNFVHGRGLIWNPGERVQVYTHPLWMFLVSGAYAITREPVYSTLGLSFLVSVLALLLLVRQHGRSDSATLVAVSGLLVSRAFIDYSTSGLENPLTHLLIIVGYAVFWNGRGGARTLGQLAAITAMAALNRLDSTLLFVPPLLVLSVRVLRSSRLRSTLAPLGAGFAPLVLWFLFSLVYYGFLFPNTAYAKLNTGIEQAGYFAQGCRYLLACSAADPVTSILIFGALVLSIRGRRSGLLPAAAAIAIYTVYVIRIGGDYMMGRFLSGPVVLAAIVVARSRFASPRHAIRAAVCFLVVRAVSPHALDRVAPTRGNMIAFRVCDSRGANYEATGLFRKGKVKEVDHARADLGLELRRKVEAEPDRHHVVKNNVVGMFGYYAGPHARIVDVAALSDPLLARLPVRHPDRFRPGHFGREIPIGYIGSKRTGENKIADPDLAAYYDRLLAVTNGSLWSAERIDTIWGFMTGRFDSLLDRYVERRRAEGAQTRNAESPLQPAVPADGSRDQR